MVIQLANESRLGTIEPNRDSWVGWANHAALIGSLATLLK